MKEYEYIVLATDEIFSHMITSLICIENYKRCNLSDVFRSVFSIFNELRDDYRQVLERSDGVDEEIVNAQLKTKCRYRREEVLGGFIKDMESIDKTIDYNEEVLRFYSDLDKEDVETLEMQLMVYPHLLSAVRKKEEGKQENEKEDNGGICRVE